MSAQVDTPPKPLSVGMMAPEWSLNSTPDQQLSLAALRGQPVILAFYPADWSPVCGDELTLFNELHGEFSRYRAQLLGISVDGAWCHMEFARQRGLKFPLLSDFEPKGAVARRYGVYREHEGLCERALFVVAPDGRIAWSYVAPMGINPGADGILAALDGLQTPPPARLGASLEASP